MESILLSLPVHAMTRGPVAVEGKTASLFIVAQALMNAIMKLSILQGSVERRQVHGITNIYFPILDLLKTLFLDSGASPEKGDR